MATILAHINVRSGSEARFEEIATELYRSTHSTEDNVLRYEYWRGQEAGRYYTLLAFPDFAGFLTHQTSPHHEHVAAELGKVIETIRLEWLDPIVGAAPLPPTVAQDVAADADELTAMYAKRYAAVIAPWWPARPA